MTEDLAHEASKSQRWLGVWFPGPMSTILPPRDTALLAGAPNSAMREVTCLWASLVAEAQGQCHQGAAHEPSLELC